MQWTRTFPGIEYKAATKGYFNGWRAGRKASMFFLAAAGVAAVLLLLRYFCGWDGHSWLVVSKVEVERSEPDTYWARDVDGNSVQIRKGTWGDYQGSDGRYYTRNGDTFHPNGIDNDDGPYHK